VAFLSLVPQCYAAIYSESQRTGDLASGFVMIEVQPRPERPGGSQARLRRVVALHCPTCHAPLAVVCVQSQSRTFMATATIYHGGAFAVIGLWQETSCRAIVCACAYVCGCVWVRARVCVCTKPPPRLVRAPSGAGSTPPSRLLLGRYERSGSPVVWLSLRVILMLLGFTSLKFAALMASALLCGACKAQASHARTHAHARAHTHASAHTQAHARAHARAHTHAYI
jgi:hypothetical protein